MRSLFEHHLGDLYRVHIFRRPKAMAELAGSKQRHQWLLSQSYFGWASNRPRMYTVLTLKDHGSLVGLELDVIESLYRVPNLSASSHMLAPPESRHLELAKYLKHFLCECVLV